MLHLICCGFKSGQYMMNAVHARCVESIPAQTLPDSEYVVHVSEDTDSDRQYLLHNTHRTVAMANPSPDDVLVFIDLDDFLCDEDALLRIKQAYDKQSDLLLTYGTCCNLSNGKRSKFSGAYKDGENFRTSPWRATHLKTMKAKLFDAIPDECFKDQNGQWFKCAADRAMMIPAMEIAGHKRIKHMELVSYCYNDRNPLSVWNTNKLESKAVREYISRQEPITGEVV